MVKAQKIISWKVLTLSPILSIGLLGGNVKAAPGTPDPFGDYGAFGGQKAATVIRQGTTKLDQNQKEAGALAQQQAQLQKPDPAISQRLGQIDRENQQITDTGGYGLQHFPTDSYVLSAVADQAMRTDPRRAQALADQAVASAGNDKKRIVDAYNTRSLIAEKTGDFPAAAADAKRVLAVDPANNDALGRWFANKDRVKAGGAVPGGAAQARPVPAIAAPSPYRDPQVQLAGERALARQQAIGFYNKAKASNDLGDAAQAFGYAQAAIKADPSLPDGYMERAKALLGMKTGDRKDQLVQAISDLRAAMELWMKKGQTDRLAEASGLSAKAKNDSGDHAGALDDADKAASYDAGYAPAYWQRGVAREALKQKQLALADYNKSADLDPQVYGAPRDAAAARLMAPDGAGPSAPVARKARFDLIFFLAGLAAVLGVAAWMVFGKRSIVGVHPLEYTPTPRVIGGHIELRGELDRGGMGVVLKGFDTKLERHVAVKRLRPELQDRQRERDRIFEEAQTLAKFHHPNIVEVHEVITEGEDVFIVCPLLDGHTVHVEINGLYLKPRRVLEIAAAVAQAIDYAHDKGVIHRDLKPSNIMVTKDGRILVMDFGISRSNVDHSRVTRTENIVGTPAYMAPEQEMGAVCKQSDVWALGASVYEMLSGRLPFATSDLARKLEKRSGRFAVLSSLMPGLPPALDPVFEKALDGDPALRQKNCMEFFRDLEAVLRPLS